MLCKKCGAELPEGTKFCTNCGTIIHMPEVETCQNVQTTQLRCKSCNGIMNIDPEHSLLECPSCGSKELIVEDKDVVIEKIRNQTEQEKQQTYRDIELSKMQFEAEKQKRQEEQEQLQKFKKGKFNKIILIFAAICAICCFTSFSNHKILQGIIALVQVIILIASWCMGMQFIKEKRKSTHMVLAMVAFLLIIPFLRFSFSSNNSSSHENETFTWPESGISSVIPQPKSNAGYIVVDSEDMFSVDVYKISKEDYGEYLTACQDKGFTIDSSKGTISYTAYNEEGYYIRLSYYDSKNSMSIHIDAPKVTGTFEWPKSELVSLLPKPESNIGSISSESSHNFIIYVGNTTKEEYNSYVNECSEKGFNIDYEKGDDYYYAYNENGYYLSLKYEGYNTIYIRIEEPSEDFIVEQQETEKSSELDDGRENTQNSNEPIDEQENADNSGDNFNDDRASSVDGIRPEFKEAMDSYEAFFDEYVEFMKKYDSSTDPSSLLSDYLSFMTRYTEAMESLSEIDDGSLSAAETLYYTEVMTRINAKLMDL